MTDQWQPIETAPKDGTTVLVWGIHEDDYDDYESPKPRIWPARVSIQKHIWWLPSGCRQINEVSHWMPLPAPPENTGGQP